MTSSHHPNEINNVNYKLYEETKSLPFGINAEPDINNLKPSSLKYNHEAGQLQTVKIPTHADLSAFNEIKYDENSPSHTSIASLTSSSNAIPCLKNTMSANTMPCTEISPDSSNYLTSLTGSNSVPQNWFTYDSSTPSQLSLLTSVSPVSNVNSYPSQTQTQSTIIDALKSNLVNYMKSSSNGIENNIEIPLGNLDVAKYDSIEDTKCFTINTESDDINLKAWYSKLKLIKAKITFETVEANALNFIPIVKNKSKYCPIKVQEIVKNAISRVYGEPIVIKGVYVFDVPYIVVDNIDSACVHNGGYILLWPTYCDCRCQETSCQCYFQNCNL